MNLCLFSGGFLGCSFFNSGLFHCGFLSGSFHFSGFLYVLAVVNGTVLMHVGFAGFQGGLQFGGPVFPPPGGRVDAGDIAVAQRK